MGNEQSKPGAETDAQSPGSEKGMRYPNCSIYDLTVQAERFDINAIEDNRQHLPKSSPVPQSPPATHTNMVGGKQKGRRNERKKEVPTSHGPARNEEEHSTTPPTAPESPVDEEKLVKTLSQREPEQFGFYDSASDDSDDKDNKSEVFYSTKWPSGSLTSTKSDSPEDQQDQHDSENDVPTQIESEIEDEKFDDLLATNGEATAQQDKSAPDQGSPSAASGIVSGQESANDNAVERVTGKGGRYPCPCAEEYNCKDTFSSKSSAKRHGEGHRISLVCPVCERVLHRQDTFNRHVKRHSSKGIVQADAAPQNNAQKAEAPEDMKEGDGVKETGEVDGMDLDPDPDPEEPMSIHNQRYPGPRATSFDCDKTYTDPNNANYHAEVHINDMRCPLGCIDPDTEAVIAFATEQTRKRHLKRRHTREERKAVRSAEREVEGEAIILIGEKVQLGDSGEEMQDRNEGAEDIATEGPACDAQTVPQPNDQGPVIGDFDGTSSFDPHQYFDQQEFDSGITADAVIEPSPKAGGNEAESENQEEVGALDDEHEKPNGTSTWQEPKKRKRRRLLLSPTIGSKESAEKRKPQTEKIPAPTNAEAEDHATGSKFAGVFLGTPKKSRAIEAPQPTERRQSTINKFAQPYTAGSKLRHPIFHPESPEKRKRGQRVYSDVELEQNDDQTSVRKRRRVAGSAGLPSRKSKQRAVFEDGEEDGSSTGENDLAPPAAKKAIHPSKPKSRSASRKETVNLDGSTQDFEHDAEPNGEGKASENSAKPQGLVCHVCKRVYKNQSRLNRHMNAPKSHRNLLECDECDAKFYHIGAFRKHKKATGHSQEVEDEGARGRFTESEEATVKRWVELFCQEHDLTRVEFKELMQASFRRDVEWRYKFMSKQDFNDEYFDVLPHRDKRSMRRYRNLNFNTTDTSKIWSKEEDDTVIRLHEELGPRWHRIGREIDRPGEMVRQRWKFKLQIANMEHGPWTKPEETAFIDAIQEVRAASEVSLGTFNWTAVSRIVQTRTPQQCANHWRAKYAGSKKGDAWKTLENVTPATTPLASRSKMEQRLAGKLKSNSGRGRMISQHSVKESDDEDEVKADRSGGSVAKSLKSRESVGKNPEPVRKAFKSEDEDDDDNDEEDITRPPDSDSEQQGEIKERAPRSDPASDEDSGQNEEPELPRNPLAGITPGKTLSTSQAFNQTQANTSAKRFSARKGSPNPSQERPSPPITIQRIRVRSLELGTPDSELNETRPDDGEVKDDTASEVEGDDEEIVAQHDGHLENVANSDEDGVQDEPKVTVQLVDSAGGETSASESENDDASTESELGSESDLQGRPKYQTSARTKASASVSAPRARTTSADEDDSDSESGSGSGSATDSGSDSESEPTSPLPQQKSATSNRKLAQISNDFMSSIHEASQKRKQQARKPVTKWMDDSSESEDDARVPSQTLPVMSRR